MTIFKIFSFLLLQSVILFLVSFFLQTIILHLKITKKTYFIFQVTEKEIYNGILNAKQLDKNVLFFTREIEGIEESLKTNLKLAKKFIDIDKENKIDESALKLLNDLKYKKIAPKLSSSNIFNFKVISLI